MSVSRISTRYAKSLIDLAIERNELEVVKHDMDFFVQALKNRDLNLFLKTPIINSGKKLTAIKAIFEGKISKTTQAFFEITIKKGREMYLPEIAQDFIAQYKVFNKISTVKLTTATPLDDQAMSDIKSKLLASNVTMEKLDIITKVDPSIIGGLIIEIGDKLYDASITHKLDELRKDFIANKYVKTI